jgi:hypothetical protein
MSGERKYGSQFLNWAQNQPPARSGFFFSVFLSKSQLEFTSRVTILIVPPSFQRVALVPNVLSSLGVFRREFSRALAQAHWNLDIQ